MPRRRSTAIAAAIFSGVYLCAATAPATVLVTSDTSFYSFQSGVAGTVPRQLPITLGFNFGDTKTINPPLTHVSYGASGSRWSLSQPNGVNLQNYSFTIDGAAPLNDPSYLPSGGISVNDLVQVSIPAGAPDAVLKFGPASLQVTGTLADGDELNLLLECSGGGVLQLTGYNTPGAFQFTVTGAEQDFVMHAGDSQTLNYYQHIFTSISHSGTGTSSIMLTSSKFALAVPEPSGLILAAFAIADLLLPTFRRRRR